MARNERTNLGGGALGTLGRGRIRRTLLGIGALSFAVGIGLLAYGLLYDSGGGSRPQADLRDLGDQPIVRIGATPAPTNSGPTPVPVPPLGDQAYNLVIEKIAVDAPVRTYGIDQATIDTEPAPEVPTGPDAADIVAWYDFSAKPGTGSNAIFAGHVTWFGTAVFYDLAAVAPGDTIRLRGTDGTEMVYSVSTVFEVDPADPDSVAVMRPTDEDVITLITCTGTFTDTGDPIFGGDYSSRLIVRAGLQAVNKAPAVAAGGG